MRRLDMAELSGRCVRVLALVMMLTGLQACVLDRTGGLGCPKDGAISCNVYHVSHSFTSEDHSYIFKGQCTLIEEKGKSELNDPTIKFTAAGEFHPQSLEFSESVLVEHDTFPLQDSVQTSWNLTGTSALDPWLYPTVPVGVKHVNGDPNEFAKGLCVATVPGEYRRLPFSRNVIVHMLSLQQLLAMRMEAASGATASAGPDDPPPPPCPESYLTAAPEVVMPTENLVYKADVQGVTVELRSKCGVDNVDYGRSIYGLRFERYESGPGWEEYRTFEIPMTSYAHGGSQGFDTLPLAGNGLWRVKAIHYITRKGSSTGDYGAWGDWTHFRIGDANMSIDQLENLPGLIQADGDNAFRKPPEPGRRAYKSIPLRSKTSEAIRSREQVD